MLKSAISLVSPVNVAYVSGTACRKYKMPSTKRKVTNAQWSAGFQEFSFQPRLLALPLQVKFGMWQSPRTGNKPELGQGHCPPGYL